MQYPVLNTDSIKADITETRAKIPLLLKGDWHVPGFGLMSVTDDYITKLTSNFDANVLGFTPYATLGHPTDSPDPESIDGQRKRGKLEKIVTEGDVVYGLYNINRETYDLIKNGDYEYSSPEIQQNFRDKTTGELKGPTLLRTALTNAPFMPFNDNKIIALSQNSNDVASVCIKLSTSIKEVEESINVEEITPNLNNEISSPEVVEIADVSEILTEVTIKQAEEIIPNNKNKQAEEITQMTVPSEVTTTPVEQSVPAVDIESILNKVLTNQQTMFTSTVEGVTNKFNEVVESMSTKTNETVNALLTEVASLKTQVTSAVERTQEIDKANQFITALSSSEQAKQLNFKLNGLFEAGVSPSALSLAKSIIKNGDGNSVVKLSVSGKDTEVSLEDSIVELLKLSANAMPNITQEGSQTTANKPSYLSSVIESNKAKADARVKK